MTGTCRIIQAEALAWLAEHPAAPGSSVITSLPDVSECAALGFDGWRAWFVEAARAVIRWVPPDGVAIFYQSDIRREGVWVDKSYFVMRAGEEERAQLVWHKIVCRSPPGTLGFGRPSYSHMLCFARDAGKPPFKPGPDVLADAGAMSWSKAMGSVACQVACDYLRDETDTAVVVDPFCGRGSVLAVASAMGFDVLGVDQSAKRCRAARSSIARAAPEPDAYLRGARLFDDGAYFDAHEVWEERWRISTDDSERIFLQGLIQIAAGFHKLWVARSPEPALRLLGKGLAKLERCPAEVGGLDLAGFRAEIDACALRLAAGGLEPASVPKMLAAERT